MATVYLSIGSNIERETHIRTGINALKKQFGNVDLSSVYEAAAVGFDGEPFLNLIAAFSTQKSPAEVDTILDAIEKENGRTSEQKKFNPRTLDLDLILYDDYISGDPNLEIPRDEITRYAFVLEPLAELAGDLKHPVTQQSYKALWAHFDKQGLMQKRISFDWG
ncbi:MAG: 2-amino-4-hydroxy-6-hydroxymethyldihydropteridine pyrophosphokinase [Cycloclasticus sp. symbiont of Bathymodiolus heckerae]|nr:MAG: 2-amino-4-hydroxy-6-hydroxymethyldihydropteridine pyrophosphokinase [Cycloclasticus sp. symbiont of Bathymodiolus heckerae]